MRGSATAILAATLASVVGFSGGAAALDSTEETLWHHRNLGKAFYENSTTQLQAVEEFKKALDLVPGSARERVNYGLALLRAGKTSEGVAELQQAQQQDPSIPHTWFNLGITYKKESEYDKAIQQFEQMVKIVPDEPVSHYNLGVLYKLTGKQQEAVSHFETAARLDPNLAGPHFQLYNAYRFANRAEDSARELAIFQEIKKRQAGAAVPEDLDWSFYAEIYETVEPRQQESQPAALKFETRSLPGVVDAATSGLANLDVDGDGVIDLLAWSSRGILVYKGASSPLGSTGLEDLKGVIGVAPADFNNDGLKDLCVLTESGAVLYENQKGGFRRSASTLPAGTFRGAVWVDFDHDYDLDLVLLGSSNTLARNNGVAGFSDQTTDFPFVKGDAVAGANLDLIADTNGFDIVVVYRDRPAVIYRDKLAGKYEAVPLEGVPSGATSVAAYDFNSDSWTDFVAGYPDRVILAVNRAGKFEFALGPQGAKGELALADFQNRALTDLVAGGGVFRNTGLSRFVADASGTPSAVSVSAADFDGDSLCDLALVTPDGSVKLLRNETPGAGSWLQVGLTGVKNLLLAPAAEIEVKAGARYQKRTYGGTPLVFGLGTAAVVDTVRITWPNGTIQNQPNEKVNIAQVYKEAQRLSGSCPMIFTWNGRSFEFITDVLGVAPLGASSGGGGYFPLDHDEYAQIPGSSLVPQDGEFQVRITEELREVSYLDKVELIALDRPANVDIFTNDKFKSPPFPDFRLFGVAKRIYPVAARDTAGHDVLSRLTRKDHSYVDGFRRAYSGTAETHHLELDFGSAAPGNRAVLILNGWVDWPDGSTFVGASQEGKGGIVLPYLQVKNESGEWTTAIEDMGIPAGKPKTIAVDLSGKFRSASREIRIVTNMCVYWDEIFLGEDDSSPATRLTPLSARSAELRFRGFSTPVIHPERKQPEYFEYGRLMPLSMWNPTSGNYTRYGDVRELAISVDDRLIVMGSGDELELRFPAMALPLLPEGWERDFLLLVDGWAKDGDPNTAFSSTVDPLPFHGMSGYPYPSNEAFPDGELHRKYRQQYNTRPALRLIRPLAETRTR